MLQGCSWRRLHQIIFLEILWQIFPYSEMRCLLCIFCPHVQFLSIWKEIQHQPMLVYSCLEQWILFSAFHSRFNKLLALMKSNVIFCFFLFQFCNYSSFSLKGISEMCRNKLTEVFRVCRCDDVQHIYTLINAHICAGFCV